MRSTFTRLALLFAALVTLALTAGLLLSQTASAATVACGGGNLTNAGALHESVTAATGTLYVAAPNTLAAGKLAEFKTTENASTLMTHCNNNNAAIHETEIVIVGQDGLTYALTNRGGDRVFFEQAHGYASQIWTWSGANPYTFQNVKSGLYMRAPNAGATPYGAVAAGASSAAFTQS
jgi:hypothetical protein